MRGGGGCYKWILPLLGGTLQASGCAWHCLSHQHECVCVCVCVCNDATHIPRRWQHTGVSLFTHVQKYEGQYTSKSWAAAYGWPKPELPVNQSPDELWAAAKRMDATKGTPISALLCRFSQLADYMEAKEE